MSMTRNGVVLVGLSLLMAACASAEKRLEQGMELENQGRFDQAVGRYVESLEKDPELQEARERLVSVGDSAIRRHLEDAWAWGERGDPIGRAHAFQRADGIVARARSVGVRLPLPDGYMEDRRSAFDGATEMLLDEGRFAAERGSFQEAIQAYRRAEREFLPTAAQRDAAVYGQAEALVTWSQWELEDGRLRSAYDLGAQAQSLDRTPRDLSVEAQEVMARALELGEVELMPLPVVIPGRVRDPRLLELEIRVNDLLDRGPWQEPPPFVRMTDVMTIRDVVRQASLLGGLQAPAMGLLLRVTEADYGAWLELVGVEAVEFDVDQSTRSVRTRDGQPTTFLLERGQRRLRAEARVVVVDRDGNPVSDVTLFAQGSGRFERGVYNGNPAELNLDRREIDWFDRVALERQEQAIREALALDLADQLALAVFDPVLARIP